MNDYLNELCGEFAEIRKIRGIDVVYVASDMSADYANIRQKVGLFPFDIVSYWKIAGDDAEETLDSLLTKSIQYLNYGQNRMCYFLTDAGEIAAMITIYKNDDTFIIEAFKWDEDVVAAILNNHQILFEKLDYGCILLEGASAVEFMTDEMGLAVDYFVYQSHQDLECFDEEVIVARTGYTGEYGYKVIGDREAIKKIWANLLPENKESVAGYAAFELCQYEIKQPFWELPYQALSKNIFETDYQWLIDFKKDSNYVGKDALYSIQAEQVNRKLIGAVSETEIKVGIDLFLESEKIGSVIDSRYSIGAQKYLSLIFVDQTYAHANIPLTSGNGELLTTVSAPYVYPASWSAKN
jgi:glycine cleavage system aminomethyltransferase T